MNDNAEKWETASSELRSAFYARMVEVEKVGISYVLLKRQRKLLRKQLKDCTEAQVFYWKAIWVVAAALALLEYIALQNVRGYFSVCVLLYISLLEILKSRFFRIEAEIARTEDEIMGLSNYREISSIALSKGSEKYFEIKLFGTFDGKDEMEDGQVIERKKLEAEVFLSLIERKSNPFL
jgi:hypothetical protein